MYINMYIYTYTHLQKVIGIPFPFQSCVVCCFAVHTAKSPETQDHHKDQPENQGVYPIFCKWFIAYNSPYIIGLYHT